MNAPPNAVRLGGDIDDVDREQDADHLVLQPWSVAVVDQPLSRCAQ